MVDVLKQQNPPNQDVNLLKREENRIQSPPYLE